MYKICEMAHIEDISTDEKMDDIDLIFEIEKIADDCDNAESE